jgi:hypothetical protein
LVTPGPPRNPRLLLALTVVFLVHLGPTLLHFPLSLLRSAGPIVNDDYPKSAYFTEIFRRGVPGLPLGRAYDPHFYAGYVTDLGNATCHVYLAAGALLPGLSTAAVIKGTVLSFLLLYPLLYGLAAALYARSAGAALVAGLLASLAGQWGYPYIMAWVGNVTSVFGGGLAAVAGGLAYRSLADGRFRRDAIALSAACSLGWLVHPLFPVLAAPAIAGALAGGRRGAMRGAFAAMLVAAAVATAANAWWLVPYAKAQLNPELPGRVAAVAGTITGLGYTTYIPFARVYGNVLHASIAAAGAIGLVVLATRERRLAAVLAVSAVLAAALFRASSRLPWLWSPRSALMIDGALIVAAGAAAASLGTRLAAGLRRPGRPRPIVAVPIALAIVAPFLFRAAGLPWTLLPEIRPFEAAPAADQAGAIRWIEAHTDDRARVLFEDVVFAPPWGHRVALLARMTTGRQFVGGPAGDNPVTANWITFQEGFLAFKPIAEYSRDALAAFLRRYNIGWVMAFTPQAIAAFDRAAGIVEPAGAAGPFHAYRVPDPPGFFVRGRGVVDAVAVNRLALSGLEPENGEVVLRYHYAPGLVTDPPTPITGVPVDGDPQAFIRLASPPRRVVIRMAGTP